MGEPLSNIASTNILPFRRAGAGRANRPPVAPHPGEILFFTGVRYCRDADDEAAGPDTGPATDDGAQSGAAPGRRKRRRA